MGVVFSIYKRKPKERYELGKHFHGFRPGHEPSGIKSRFDEIYTFTQLIFAALIENPIDADKLSRLQARRMALTDPGWIAMWSIMDTPNYSVFKMSRWTREELADKIWHGSSNVDTHEQAMLVADHLLNWAGDSDVTLNPEEPSDLSDIGWPIRGYRLTGSLWEALR